jgi:hypothetical protein
LIQAEPGQETQRLPFLTIDMGIKVFAEELGLLHLVPIVRYELAQELAAMQIFSEVTPVLKNFDFLKSDSQCVVILRKSMVRSGCATAFARS